MNLPKNEKSFTIDMVGETTNERFVGNFTCCCVLSIGKKHQLELDKSRLSGDLTNPSDKLLGLSFILANLRTRILSSPDWWKENFDGLDLLDENVLVEVFNQVQKAEDEWRKEVKQRSEKKRENSIEKTEETAQ